MPFDIPSDLKRAYQSADIVYVVSLAGTGPFVEYPEKQSAVVSIEAVWKGPVVDQARIWLSSDFESFPEVGSFVLLANSKKDGYHTLGACTTNALQFYGTDSNKSPLKFMTEIFGEPAKPTWHATSAYFYFGYFLIMALLVGASMLVFRLVSHNKTLKVARSARRTPSAPLN